MPKFSIIIPVYNVAPYLRECLDSVLAQTSPTGRRLALTMEKRIDRSLRLIEIECLC